MKSAALSESPPPARNWNEQGASSDDGRRLARSRNNAWLASALTVLHLLHAAYHTLRISVPTLAAAARGTLSPEICDKRLDDWSRRLVEFAEIDLSVIGREHLAPGEAFVVMSNHQSLYDIPVLFQVLRRRLRMVAKTELFRVPIWGKAMRLSGMVEVDRNNRAAAMRSLVRARTAVQEGTSIWIAPEGTRSPDGRLGEFKKGGFHLATATRARILPVSIDGTRFVLPAKGSEVCDAAQVTVTLHPPIATDSPRKMALPELMTLVEQLIASGLSTETEIARQ